MTRVCQDRFHHGLLASPPFEYTSKATRRGRPCIIHTLPWLVPPPPSTSQLLQRHARAEQEQGGGPAKRHRRLVGWNTESIVSAIREVDP